MESEHESNIGKVLKTVSASGAQTRSKTAATNRKTTATSTTQQPKTNKRKNLRPATAVAPKNPKTTSTTAGSTQQQQLPDPSGSETNTGGAVEGDAGIRQQQKIAGPIFGSLRVSYV